MSNEFVHDPNETYEYVCNPSNVEDPHWMPCTQAEYYLFAQVVPVRVLVPVGLNSHFVIESAEGLPIPLDSMKPVELVNEKEIEAGFDANDHDSDVPNLKDWTAAWKAAVKAVEAKLPERLKNSLFVK